MDPDGRARAVTNGAATTRGPNSSSGHHPGDGNSQSNDDADISEHSSNAEIPGRPSGQGQSRPTASVPLPRPHTLHNGWEPSNVATAKCDMCHRQRCGVIQKCSDCKLSVCRECAFADRLSNDVRHALDPTTVEWDSRTVPRGRGTGGSRARRSRGGGAPRGSGHGRGQGEAAASATTTPSPQTDLGSHTSNDSWAQNLGRQAASIQVNNDPHNQIMQRKRSHIGPANTPVTQQAQNAAQILATMPNGRQVDRHDSSQKGNKYDDILPDSTLPPLRAVPDPIDCSLPPLTSMYPEMSRNDVAAHQQGVQTQCASASSQQMAPTAFMSPEPAQEDPVHYQAQYGYGETQHHPASHGYQTGYVTAYHGGGESTAASYFPPTISTAQNASNQQYVATGAQYSTASYGYGVPVQSAPEQQHAAAQNQYNPVSYGTQSQYGEQAYVANPAPQSFTGQQYAASQDPYGCVTYASHPPMQEAYSFGSFSQAQQVTQPMNQLAPMEPSFVSTSVPGLHALATLPMMQATPQPWNPQTSSVESVQAQLVQLARGVKHSEHADWPMEFCLRLAVQRSWAATLPTITGTSSVYRALAQFLAATNRAISELNLPETNNSARVWLREEQRRICAPTANPSNRLSLSNYLSNPPRGNAA
ncbi:hypothetical protein VFPFJ_03273 [Purpureocillium lilacinum]|uniref:Uncharacterized protein n=1 Tax=Purpureocillium lilacinum TaxID=33203 RepID=A0A179HQB5_PURLI|nr:hypothetical protein VFPFJ_03273 [Purpureocillium lilacinum]OAQ91533.1 hypothetical protein VFPFJ_03273 [Purpureocillium lilacinum]PWI67575.1 hypothetical protein PCL_02929 [Purpureocillium lilacinum]